MYEWFFVCVVVCMCDLVSPNNYYTSVVVRLYVRTLVSVHVFVYACVLPFHNVQSSSHKINQSSKQSAKQ